MRSQLGVVAGAGAVLASALLIFLATDRLPAPAAIDAPATQFSAARARPIVEELAALGPHHLGSDAVERAAELLAARLRKIPGLEVEIQHEQRIEPYLLAAYYGIGYQVTNVVARLRGESDEALLLAAHFDSTPFGPGAGDNATGVAVAIEALRALAAGPKPKHSLVVLLDGGEEADLLGAIAFAHHPWARSVRSFVNLESLGRGRTALLRSPADGGAMLHAAAHALPRVFANPLGHDLQHFARLRIIDTNYAVFRDYLKISGIDLAHTKGVERYHAPDDTAQFVDPGSLQEMGELVMALAQRFTSSLPAPKLSGEWATYLSVLGRWLIVVELAPLRWLGRAVALALAILLGVEIFRRGRVLGAWVLRALAALLLGVGLAMLVGRSLGWIQRVHAWASQPLLGVALFSLIALLGWHLVIGRGAARATVEHTRTIAVAAVLPWTVVAVIAAEKGMRVGLYLLVLSIALLVIAALGRRAWLAVVVGGLLVSVVAIEGLATPAWALGPMARVAFMPFDLPFSGGCALATLYLAAVLAPMLAGRAAPARVSLVLAGLAVVLGAILLVPYPYTAERAIRTYAVWSRGLVRLLPTEPVSIDAAVAGVARPIPAQNAYPFLADATHEVRVEPFETAPRLRIEVVSIEDEGGERRAKLRVSGMTSIRLRVSPHGLLGWSLGEPLPKLPPKLDRYWILLDGHRDARWDLTLRYRAESTLPIEISGVDRGPDAFDASALAKRLGASIAIVPMRNEVHALVLPARTAAPQAPPPIGR